MFQHISDRKKVFRTTVLFVRRQETNCVTNRLMLGLVVIFNISDSRVTREVSPGPEWMLNGSENYLKKKIGLNFQPLLALTHFDLTSTICHLCLHTESHYSVIPRVPRVFLQAATFQRYDQLKLLISNNFSNERFSSARPTTWISL